ncbi:hypothetical protein ACFQX7_00275 [Luedemannella flava]
MWTGNTGKEQPLRLKNGALIYGGTIPGPIFREFVVRATDALHLTHKPFGQPVFLGDQAAGNTPAPK